MSTRLPLGVDLGSTRVRVAAAQRSRTGANLLNAIAGRDLPEDDVTPNGVKEPELVAAVIDDLVREIGTREKRCILCVSADAASVRWIRFPRMSAPERRKAARFEAARFAGWDVDAIPSLVRVHPIRRDDDVYAVGIVRRDGLESRIDCAKRAGLRPVAVDFDANALRRGFPASDAVLDVAHRQAWMHVFAPTGTFSLRIVGGGVDVTRAIAADLRIDERAAEKRKRTLGTAGAGESARGAFAASVAEAVGKARERFAGLTRIALTGNGSRLTGLRDAVEAACHADAALGISDLLRGAYPEDVVRAAAPDWTLAASLAAWGCDA